MLLDDLVEKAAEAMLSSESETAPSLTDSSSQKYMRRAIKGASIAALEEVKQRLEAESDYLIGSETYILGVGKGIAHSVKVVEDLLAEIQGGGE